ncbi:hypothetical protein Q2T83_14730 [Fervidibacter sacchari]|uniref:Uncharacterized protein n=1 Tax=Candidatus Fervidibacter sacchari TaxID=1448929 RepID=A0ABT2EIH4_9BACT|nr:hypothetical protein [Candidatus Fervidibacter sacchari]MCS3917752.1 hypothetical protein [Candidatus Fervidibacter sacchari]WKU15575.1 hypothetical protein Q2T83_14730 [Candidatus Fervidibacter sacchari]
MPKKRAEIQDADERFVRVIVGLHKLSQWAKEAGITEKELIREARRQWKLLRKEKREGEKVKGSR